MDELEQEDVKAKPTQVESKEEETIEEGEKDKEENTAKPINKSLVNLSHATTESESSAASSETSSLAPEDELTLNNSEEELKKSKEHKPRKLIEDEQRAKGRIAWPVWRLYFTVSCSDCSNIGK
jgi:hypothetical protein